MEEPAQPEEQPDVAITYRVEIFAARAGEEMRLVPLAPGSGIRELAENLVAQALDLESEAKEKLDQVEAEAATELGRMRRAERSGRRHRSWE